MAKKHILAAIGAIAAMMLPSIASAHGPYGGPYGNPGYHRAYGHGSDWRERQRWERRHWRESHRRWAHDRHHGHDRRWR